MDVVSYSELRRSLKARLDKVCDDHAPLLVTRHKGKPVVVMSLAEYEELDETSYLLRSPANAERLRRGIEDANAGRLVEHDLKE